MHKDIYGSNEFFEIIICFENASTKVSNALVAGYPNKGNIRKLVF